MSEGTFSHIPAPTIIKKKGKFVHIITSLYITPDTEDIQKIFFAIFTPKHKLLHLT